MKKTIKLILSLVLGLAGLALLTYLGIFLYKTLTAQPMELADVHSDNSSYWEGPDYEVAPEEPEEEEIVEEEPEEEPDINPLLAAEYMKSMTLDEKIWQLFFVSPEDLTGVPLATRAGDMTKTALEQKPVGGILYNTGNFENMDQTKEMLSLTQSYLKTPAFLAVDEEGGRVSRLTSVDLGVTDIGTPADIGIANDPDGYYHAANDLALQMKALGLNMNFAPVADLASAENTEIGDRAYSSVPTVAGTMAANMVRGLQDGGIVSCLKHFPGHGSAQSDSHQGTAVSTRTLDELRAEEWESFRMGLEADAQFVMMSHLTNENLSSAPSSMAPETVSYLRDELGFENIIITDSLKMGAIVNVYTSSDVAVSALLAGCDMVLCPNDLQMAFDGIKAALEDGRLTEERINESVLRVLTVKCRMGILPTEDLMAALNITPDDSIDPELADGVDETATDDGSAETDGTSEQTAPEDEVSEETQKLIDELNQNLGPNDTPFVS